jgi:hypothetical protein
MENKNSTQRVAKLRAEMKEKGYVRVEVWAPADKREQLLKYAAKLRKEIEQ